MIIEGIKIDQIEFQLKRAEKQYTKLKKIKNIRIAERLIMNNTAGEIIAFKLCLKILEG